MSSSSQELLKKLQNKYKTLDSIRNKQEDLFYKKIIIKRDIEEVYSAIFLDAIVNFEAFLEELFFGILLNRIRTSYPNVKAKIVVSNKNIANDLVLRDKNYYPWLPYKDMKKIAKLLLVDGRPFTFLTSYHEDQIDKCLAIRNAIAHMSEDSKKKFKIKIQQSIGFNLVRPNPKKFLRLQYSFSPPLNYYQKYIGELLGIAQLLC